MLASEQLAKSETSRKLLSYLAERALRDEAPKETEIAFDVFGKDPSFSGAEQSIVRVSVRTLRQKLAEHYAGPGRDSELRFDIPKGGYRLTAVRNEARAEAVVVPAEATAVPAEAIAPPRSSRWKWLAAAALAAFALSVAINLYLWNRPEAAVVAADPQLNRVRSSPLWS